MKLLRLAPLLWAALSAKLARSASTTGLASLPACSKNCLLKAIEQSPCSISNQTCLCTDRPLQASVQVCIPQSCTIKETLFTKNVTDAACQVPIRNRASVFSRLNTGLTVVSWTFAGLRLFYKATAAASELGADDWTLIVLLAVGLPSAVLNEHGQVANGLGRDVWTLSFTQITALFHYSYALEALYFVEVALLKLTLLFFYRRIFSAKPVSRLLWATIAFNVMYGFAFVLVALFQCLPVDYYWKRWDGEHSGRCINVNALVWSNAAISIALDLWMLGIPIYQLTKLQMQLKKKIFVGMMFCVGTFITIVSILRLNSLVLFARSPNPSWDLYDISVWSTLEINIGIVCVCMPTLRVLLSRLFPKLLGLTTNPNRYYYSGDGTRMTNSTKNTNSRISRRIVLGAPPAAKTNTSIMRSYEYDVSYGDNDETNLVAMDNIENMGAAHKAAVDNHKQNSP